MRSRLTLTILGVLGMTGLMSCSRAPSSAYERTILDEQVRLTLAGRQFTATREWIARDDATCVAIVEENDTDLTLNLSASNAATPIPPVTVESRSNGPGIEVAAMHVPRATRMVLSLTGQATLAAPGSPSVRVSCYADATATEPGAAARIDSYMAWTRATPAGPIVPEQSHERIADIDRAIASLELPDGDPRMAAWAHYVRAILLYQLNLSWSEAYHAARRAEIAFAALAPPDAHNIARARYLAALSLLEIVTDGTAKNPTAAEAETTAGALLLELARPGGHLNERERLRALNLRGLLCYEINDYPCAERHWKDALVQARANLFYSDEIMVTGNLGVLAMERGDYVASSNYYSQAIERR